MSELVEVRLQNGSTMFVEVEETPRRVGGPAGGLVDRGDPIERGLEGDDYLTRGEPALRSAVAFSESVQTIKSAAADILGALVEIKPSSCEISFGVKLSGSVGAMIAKAATEANFTIKMTWNDLQKP